MKSSIRVFLCCALLFLLSGCQIDLRHADKQNYADADLKIVRSYIHDNKYPTSNHKSFLMHNHYLINSRKEYQRYLSYLTNPDFFLYRSFYEKRYNNQFFNERTLLILIYHLIESHYSSPFYPSAYMEDSVIYVDMRYDLFVYQYYYDDPWMYLPPSSRPFKTYYYVVIELHKVYAQSIEFTLTYNRSIITHNPSYIPS